MVVKGGFYVWSSHGTFMEVCGDLDIALPPPVNLERSIYYTVSIQKMCACTIQFSYVWVICPFLPPHSPPPESNLLQNEDGHMLSFCLPPSFSLSVCTHLSDMSVCVPHTVWIPVSSFVSLLLFLRLAVYLHVSLSSLLSLPLSVSLCLCLLCLFLSVCLCLSLCLCLCLSLSLSVSVSLCVSLSLSLSVSLSLSLSLSVCLSVSSDFCFPCCSFDQIHYKM